MTFHSSMAEVLRLTRSGSLAEATAVLQQALGSGISAAAPPAMRPAGGQIEQGDAGSFEERTFRSGAGSMSYRLYRPARAVANMPLVVMLHGCTQSPEDFARGTGMNQLADALGFLVAYPRQSQSANPQKCWNWFRPGDQHRDRGEPALLAGVTREVIAEHAVDAGKVFIAGLSAGGAAAAVMAAAYPDLYAAVGIHSGLGCGAARDVPSALAAMKRGSGAAGTGAPRAFVPVITFHGDRDTTVDEVNSREIIAAASAAAGVPLDVKVEQGSSPSGRRYTRRSSATAQGEVLVEQWTVEGLGHAWSGGNSAGSYTDPSGPDASREMLRFFLDGRRS